VSMTTSQIPIVLEDAAQEFVQATAEPPYTWQISAADNRAGLDELQSGPIDKPDVDVHDLTIETEQGPVAIRILRPAGACGPLPVILYLHGAGWVMGSPISHDRLVRKLANGTGAAVVFVDYHRAPEAQYPIALEECYVAARWVVDEGAQHKLDGRRMAIAGDSCGGNLAAAVTLAAKERSGPAFTAQVLFYPVTDANFDTESYDQFAEGYFLRRDSMQWFWDQYLPDTARREEILASPLRATIDQLRGLPPALVINGQADVLRDEGEAYASKLRAAGVQVTATRYQGIIHDFVMLHALAGTNASRAAIEQAITFLQPALQ
jgi:acetyl esterase